MQQMSLQKRTVTVDGIRSPVLDTGDDQPEAVVFVHGNPGSSRDWRNLAEHVGTFVRAVAPDMPGFGRADKPANFDYTVPGYARHLDGLINELGIERVHLVLHDFGGPWGLTWAAAHPDQVASIVLVNTGILPGYRWHYMAKIWRTPILGELFQATATRRAFHFLLNRDNPQGLPHEFIDGMYDDYDQGTRRAILRLYRATSNPGGLSGELAEALRQVACPVLVIWGMQDPYIDPSYAERQREFFADAHVVMLEESGHWPYADDPNGVLNAMTSFLRHQV